MRFKLDENIPTQVFELLRELGHECATIIDEGLSGARDAEVASAALREDRMLITLDRGFGDVRTYPPGGHPGIVVIRTLDQSARDVAGLTASFVQGYDLESLRGCLVIVEESRVRVRWPSSG